MQPDHYPVPPHESIPHFGQVPASQIQESHVSHQQYSTTVTPPHNLNISAGSGPSAGQFVGNYPASVATSSGALYAGSAAGAQYASYSGGSPMPSALPGGSTYFSAQSTGVPPSAATSVANYSNQASVTYSLGPVQQSTTTTTYQAQSREQRQDSTVTGAYGSPVQDHSKSMNNQNLSSYQQGLATSGTNSRYMSAAQGAYSASQYTTHRLASGATETSRVIGVEYGPERVISVQQHVVDNAQVVGERTIEHEIRIPKKIVREDVYEVTYQRTIPETVVHEEVIEETRKVRERIREVVRPVIEEKIIERPEIEIVEKIVEQPEIQYREKIREEIQLQRQERVIEVPVVVPQERIVEIPDVQYREVPVERIIEVPEIREEVVVRQVPVPQYVDKPIPQYVEVEVPNIVERNIPVPVEAVVAYEFRIPKLKGHYTKVTYPVYLPRFVETPIPAELYNAAITSKAEHYLQQISSLTRTAASLCEIENLAFAIMSADLSSQCQQIDLQAAVLQAWNSGMQFTTGTAGMITSNAMHSGLSATALSTAHSGYATQSGLAAQSGMIHSQSALAAQSAAAGATGTLTTTTTTTTANASPSHHTRVQRRTVQQTSSSPVAHH